MERRVTPPRSRPLLPEVSAPGPRGLAADQRRGAATSQIEFKECLAYTLNTVGRGSNNGA